MIAYKQIATEPLRFDNILKAGSFEELSSHGLRGEQLQALNTPGGFDLSHHKLLKLLLVEYQLEPSAALREVNGLNHVKAKALTELYRNGLRGEQLQALNTPGGFDIFHHKLLKLLLVEYQLEPGAALREVDGLSLLKAAALTELYRYGLRGEQLQALNTPGGFDPSHHNLLRLLLVKYQLEPGAALREVDGLNHLKAAALTELYTNGVRGEQLRALNTSGYFDLSHHKLLKLLLVKYQLEPGAALREVDGLNHLKAKALTETLESRDINSFIMQGYILITELRNIIISDSPEVLLDEKLSECKKQFEIVELEQYATGLYVALSNKLPQVLILLIATMAVTYGVIDDDTAIHIAGGKYLQLDQERLSIEALPSLGFLIKQHGIFSSLRANRKELKNSEQQHEFDRQWGLTVISGSTPI